MQVDKKVLFLWENVSPEEKKAIQSLLDTSRKDPHTLLIMAIFRDIYMFRQFVQADLISHRSQIHELESRIEDLEEEIRKIKGEEE